MAREGADNQAFCSRRLRKRRVGKAIRSGVRGQCVAFSPLGGAGRVRVKVIVDEGTGRSREALARSRRLTEDYEGVTGGRDLLPVQLKYLAVSDFEEAFEGLFNATPVIAWRREVLAMVFTIREALPFASLAQGRGAAATIVDRCGDIAIESGASAVSAHAGAGEWTR